MRLSRTLLLGAALQVAATGCKKKPAEPETQVQAAAAAEAASDSPPGIAPPPDVAAAPADAEKTSSGLASKVLVAKPGSEHPSPADTVEVHYTGWTTDGKMFDSSVARGKSVRFPLGRVIPGWIEGVQLMVPGEKRRFWIPANLAYGDTPPAGAPAGTLVFDVELLAIDRPQPAPSDVGAVPPDAKKVASGLAYKILERGKGKRRPKATDTVEVHYTGWKTDGQMFDSSYKHGKSAQFALNQVIEGWTEGLQLLAEGDKARLWIPEKLAYKGLPGSPAGMLVFDVELLSIK